MKNFSRVLKGSLKVRFILIAMMTSITIAVTVYVAGVNNQTEIESQYTELFLSGKAVLWDKVIADQLNQLELHAYVLKDENQIKKLMLEESQHKKSTGWSLQSVAKDWFEFSSDKVFTRLQLLDLNENILYSSDASLSRTNHKKILTDVINNQKKYSGLFTDDSGTIVALSAIPLMYDDEIIGVGIIESDLHEALESFKKNDHSDVLLLTNSAIAEYTSNASLFEQVDMAEFSHSKLIYLNYESSVYTLSRLAIIGANSNILAHLISANNTTEIYNSQLKRQVTSLVIIIVGLLAASVALFMFVRKVFAPIENLLSTVNRLGQGDTDARAVISSNDEIGQLGTAFNEMAQTLQNNIETERKNAEDLRRNVEEILLSVNRAAKGDLTIKMKSYADKGTISKLSEGIQLMLDNLNNIVQKVQLAGIQLLSSATQISASAREQEATITEQAASTSQVMTSITEISGISKKLLSTMSAINRVTERTSLSADEGHHALSDMEDTMMYMQTATHNISSKLTVLNEKADNINSIVTTINRVADQTNLLSLNAAIEAEKAGEYGRGFSVVASEIRRLADQTAVASWDIEKTVKEMISAVSAGVMSVEKFTQEVTKSTGDIGNVGAKLNYIIEQIQILPPQFETVTDSMKIQTQKAVQINDSIVQLNQTAHSTVESISQSSQSITLLKEAANELQQAVSIFKVEE